jgi:hypothetical protein
MFARFLPEARLLGIDVAEPGKAFIDHLEDAGLAGRVRFARGAQDDGAFLDAAIHACFGEGGVDVVIDDASHLYRKTRATYDHLFTRHLRGGGVYVIEDWGCGYWPRWGDGHRSGKKGLPRLVKELVDEVARRDRTKLFKGRRTLPVEAEEPSSIRRLVLLPGICAVHKA